MRGERDPASGGPLDDGALPVARYDYGAVLSGASGLQFTTGTPTERSYAGATSYLENLADSVSETHDLGTWDEPDGRITWTSARHVIRDFTGDAIPDLVFRQGTHWTLVPGVLTANVGVAFNGNGQSYTWDDFVEISKEATFRPPTDSDKRHWRQAGDVSWTVVDFMD